MQRDWEWLGENDPLWALCTDPSRSKGRWNVQEFLATGEAEVNRVLRGKSDRKSAART
jgi:hypothetical protein